MRRAVLLLLALAAAGQAASWRALFFVTNDCPISNHYAAEIRRICEEYGRRGVGCELVYADPRLSDETARRHAREYGHGAYPLRVDRNHELIRQTGITVTPEVAVVDAAGQVAYRGRIDDFFVSWGKSRREVTDRTLRKALDALLSGRKPEQERTKAVGCYVADLKLQ